MPYDDVETAGRRELTALQSERLRETVEHVFENVPWYREHLSNAGIDPADVSHVDDLPELPFTTKEDIRDNYPDELFAVPREDLERIHASSGTTGRPKIVAYTADDLDLWRDVMARSLYAAGVRDDDVVQNGYGYGLFTGGLGFHDGVEELGACVVPTGGGGTARQLQMLDAMASDVLSCTPSYCLYLEERAAEDGRDLRDLPLDRVLIGAEPFTEPMREEIERALDVTAIDVYGLSEIIGPGVSIECEAAQDGLHVWEDHFYPEVVDPDTGEVLPEGEAGELVLTTLTKDAFPMLRYRTGDMTRLNWSECECGRTHVRMDNVTGRTDDLLIVRGVNVYPSQIEEVVLDVPDVAPHYRIDLYREGPLDTLELTVEHAEGYAGAHDALADRIEKELHAVLDIEPGEVEVVGPGVVDRTEVGKVKRVYDHR